MSHVQVIENNAHGYESQALTAQGLPNGPLEEEGLCIEGSPALLPPTCGTAPRGLTLLHPMCLTPNKRLFSGSRLKDGERSVSPSGHAFHQVSSQPVQSVRGPQAGVSPRLSDSFQSYG